MKDLLILLKSHVRLIGLMAGLICVSFSNQAYSQVDESALKAQWINDLIPYMKWRNRPYKEITVCTIGREPVYIHLREIIKKEERETKKKGKEFSPIYVKFKNAYDTDIFQDCHILYISNSEQDNVSDILNKVKGLQVLTISSLSSFAANGGVVGFVIRNDGVKIQINEKAAHDAKIIIDSDLLGFAETFWGKPQ